MFQKTCFSVMLLVWSLVCIDHVAAQQSDKELQTALRPVPFSGSDAATGWFKSLQHQNSGLYAAVRVATSQRLRGQVAGTGVKETLCAKSIVNRLFEFIGISSDKLLIASARFSSGSVKTEWMPILALNRTSKGSCEYTVIQDGIITPYFKLSGPAEITIDMKITETDKIAISVVHRVMAAVRGTMDFSSAFSGYQKAFSKELPLPMAVSKKDVFLSSEDAKKYEDRMNNYDKVVQEIFGPLVNDDTSFQVSVALPVGLMKGRSFQLSHDLNPDQRYRARRAGDAQLIADLMFLAEPRISMFAPAQLGNLNFCEQERFTCSRGGPTAEAASAPVPIATDPSTGIEYQPPSPRYFDSIVYPYLRNMRSGYASEQNFYLNDTEPRTSAYRKITVDLQLQPTHQELSSFDTAIAQDAPENVREQAWSNLCSRAYNTFSDRLQLADTDLTYLLWVYFGNTSISRNKSFAEVGCGPLLSKQLLAEYLPRMGLSAEPTPLVPNPPVTGELSKAPTFAELSKVPIGKRRPVSSKSRSVLAAMQ